MRKPQFEMIMYDATMGREGVREREGSCVGKKKQLYQTSNSISDREKSFAEKNEGRAEKGRGEKEKSFELLMCVSVCASAEKEQTHGAPADWCLLRPRRAACHPGSISTADKTEAASSLHTHTHSHTRTLTLPLQRQTLIPNGAGSGTGQDWAG